MGNFEDSTQRYKGRFRRFTRELGKLSAKYGVTIQSVGGVTIYDLETIGKLKVAYSNDHTSGDLEVSAEIN